jgi:L-arabinose isomerase
VTLSTQTHSAPRARIALVALGLDAYWPQFEGLEARLRGYTAEVRQRVAALGVEMVMLTGADGRELSMIDTPEKAMEAGHALRRADADLLLIHVATYALSSTVLPMVQRARVPVLLLNLQPGAALDYTRFNALRDRTQMTAEWLAWCSACPLPELANVFLRARIPFRQITGVLGDDPAAWNEIGEWMRAANAVQGLAHNRLGLMGHYYSGMLDIATDLTALCATFGGHLEHIEVDELSHLRGLVSDEQARDKAAAIQKHFDVQHDCAIEELIRAARTSVALDRLVAEHRLTSMAYFHSGSGNAANEDTISSIILGTSLLTAAGVPVAGEYEVKNAIAMKIMDLLGAGGSFTEFYALDFNDDVVLMGHDGPGHTAIAEGKCKVRPLEVYHGKVGRGLSVEMSVRHGPVTLLSVVEDGQGSFLLLYAEGVSEAGPILEIGNTNSRYRFSIGVRRFMQEWSQHGPAHHCAAGVGHLGAQLEKLAALLNIRAVKVC